ncbi:uncharacterized protein LOC111829047 [Capsella rubella]|uniref:uncharacterized protein LOC111829047 n=1 Tax=Capsella rubella TaxID=81985 RepID=UPI000CD5BCA4|nr:uncharacterized protein LOC111829047 [Capsella rubella]
MKSRYFPYSDFLNATLGARPSYAWRSILHGRELLVQGLVKNIGNGKSFKVWIDAWLEDGLMRPPWRRNNYFNPDLRISELIDRDKRDWDEEALEYHFLPADIIRIKKIKPVVETLSSNQTTREEANRLPSLNPVKAQVWDLQTDPKIKVFLWKILSGALPVATALISRGMRTDNLCQICGEEDESINHVLFTCSWARQVWALSGIPSPVEGFQNETVQKSCEDWKEWAEAQVVEEEDENGGSSDDQPRRVSQNCGTDHLLKRWKRPPKEWLKCNVGVSWSSRNRLAGASWVLRDYEGNVVLHSRCALVSVMDKKDAQFKALIWAIESMKSHRVEKVVFGLEDACLVKVLAKPSVWPSFRFQSMEVGRLRGSFRDWKFFLENSFSNRGAFFIAQSVTSDCRLQSYVDRGHPSWLRGLFAEEMVSSSV